jgi:hypothetical protein
MPLFWNAPGNPPWNGGGYWDLGLVGAGNTRKRMKVKLSLKNYNPDQLVSLANAIKIALTGNAKFTNPNPTLVALAALITALVNAINAYNVSADATAAALEARNAAVEALRAALSQLMAYVENTAVTAADVESAGMQVRKDAAPVGPMPKVQKLAVSISDHAGELDWMCGPVAGVGAYVLQTCVGDPNVAANWKYADTATKSSGTLTGLAPGPTWVRVCAKGADAQPGAWSDPAEEIVR